ncbi:hypothetical protein BYT27DRAFT_7141663 [Phlegmacium glaucopus]|nr:hypothetical protein BYT27DRAFT_7141663 [Phlegmacium glaucopus]
MPLFVPILRLLMLFLNIYDSYKTLKDPPSSARNGGRPSVRAVSQRKRDMKGCLAVWIVWCCLVMYERFLESIVCLFIPFYDEFKSLVLLFLILTRARGAEPIYLHLVRPLIKPYTRTLDSTLELLLMIGDFVFALSTYPLHLALRWWHKRFGVHYEPLETDTQGGSSDDVGTSELPTSFLASSSGPQAELDARQPEAATVQLPPKVVSETLPIDQQQQLSNSARPYNSGPRFPNTTHNRNPEASSSTHPKKETRRQRTVPSSQKDSKVATGNNSSPTNMESAPLRERRRGEASSRPQIWYPPRSSYVDDGEDQADLTIRPSDPSVPLRGSQEVTIAHEQQQLDEWRQYPPFPSAYPPTPLVVTSRLAAASIVRSSTIYPPIEEERPQQDFPKSLLPPREPLNPSPAGDLSDQSFTFGIPPYHLTHRATTTDEADDSISTDDYEDEDEFNMTLRTPLQPLGSVRSQTVPRRLVSLASGSSAVPSRLSTLTTADDGSSLQSRSSSESLSPSKPIPTSVIGKKRSYPRTKPINIKNRVRQIEDKSFDEITDLDPLVVVPSGSRRRPSAAEDPNTSDTVDDPELSLNGCVEEEEPDKEQNTPEEKRRKVTRSSPRTVNASRPNIKRYTPPPPQTRKGKLPQVPPVATKKRSSSRMKSGLRTYSVEGTDASMDTSSSASTNNLVPPSVPLKSNTRQTRRKMT